MPMPTLLYTSNLNLSVKVLDFVKFGGPIGHSHMSVPIGPPDLTKSRTFSLKFNLEL